MKNLLIFLFGAVCGAGVTFIGLRKEIKKKLDEIEKTAEEEAEPFKMSNKVDKNHGSDAKKAVAQGSVVPQKQERFEYHKVIQQTAMNDDAEENDEKDVMDEIIASDETDGGVYEIDTDEFMHNHDYTQKRLIYFRGDKTMSTESGTIIANPFMLVGAEWESCVGNFANRTAFIRNPRLREDYEIYVEDCAYTDEFGVEENYRED